MYTIDDLKGNIFIQGPVKVMKYYSNRPIGEEYECCYQTEHCQDGYDIPNEFCHTHILYMYANKDGYLWIELAINEEEETK